jgi:hypothetical protein
VSEFEVDPDFYDPAEMIGGADNKLPPVTAAMFWPDGTPREEPGPGAGDALWNAYSEQLEAEMDEELAQPQPGDYPATDFEALQYTRPDVLEAAVGAHFEAVQASEAQAFRQAIADDVVAPLAREYGIRDRATLDEIAEDLDEASAEYYSSLLGRGFDPGQARAALGEANWEGAARLALADAKYERVTARTRVAQFRREQEAVDLARSWAGLPPGPTMLEKYPGLAKMAERMAGFEARKQPQKELERRWAR